MFRNLKRNSVLFFCIGSLFFSFSSVFALGTYSEGWAVVRLIQFESRGIIFDSQEGLLEFTTYDKSEKCEASKDECFTPLKEKIEFSVRPENGEVVNFLNNNVNQEILVQYRVHKIEPIALSTDFEVIGAQKQITTIPKEAPDKIIVNKSGSRRNFSVSGRILKLEYQGTIIGTYEGLYLDEVRGKVHPFSVTNEEVAAFAWNTMKFGTKYYIGVSVAFATGWRKSDYDIFEINYNSSAGGVYTDSKK
ncbi:hypothetical protein IQB76_12580 [Leptospira borgpetersenii serovar Hardjo-bovis]|uniref:Uncharacterized protein n=1 Tax=Leptospira borgpetersenii serovar Hardjo-bovis str. Sponselee TaxID=1303729 RepID=M6BGF6_LEPBO|nr:hypothetical protein [Leptospira borgpetersenii]AMX59011.1 hypothetical protein LBK6_11885 [Leptospira borgpetersenii serovar Hardjo]AMX62263.1 hypothetical protein LBK9_11925 [Leptospira borgpetersenii serovar Hardjo]AMX65506.1 hypothetical protein LBK30_11945 [Leptospira borgpetersenii serovar Hardjo]AMX68716.1 hypothetical protein LBHA_11775 [Leptospira borgpetersenii serovar Hardjo]AWV70785.1 hypothetical protein B9T54_12810 [Leptospira borgpetersenii serovar Hardjo-bovis]